MSVPDYEQRRKEAERLAKYARTPAERADFLKIAEIWRRLAEEPFVGAHARARQRRSERTVPPPRAVPGTDPAGSGEAGARSPTPAAASRPD